MRTTNTLLCMLAILFNGCVASSISTKECLTQYVASLDMEKQSALGIDSKVFTTIVPDGHVVTVWCEFYDHGELNEDMSSYEFQNKPKGFDKHPNPNYKESSVELRRTDTDYHTGQKTKKAVWSFHGGSGHLLEKDPIKMSTSSTISNLAEEKNGIVLSEGRPSLLYFMIGVESGSQHWSNDKAETIKRNDHVIFVFARLDTLNYKGYCCGGGFITSKQHPLVKGKSLRFSRH